MEYWDIYDENGLPTGRVKEKNAPFEEGEYHLVTELWIKNRKNELLIQKRSEKCELLPGIWALTTGRVRAGETPEEGCIREAREELSLLLSQKDLRLLKKISRGDGLLWEIFLAESEADLKSLSLQPDEVADARWVGRAEFLDLLKRGELFFYPEIYEVLDLALGHRGL